MELCLSCTNPSKSYGWLSARPNYLALRCELCCIYCESVLRYWWCCNGSATFVNVSWNEFWMTRLNVCLLISRELPWSTCLVPSVMWSQCLMPPSSVSSWSSSSTHCPTTDSSIRSSFASTTSSIVPSSSCQVGWRWKWGWKWGRERKWGWQWEWGWKWGWKWGWGWRWMKMFIYD